MGRRAALVTMALYGASMSMGSTSHAESVRVAHAAPHFTLCPDDPGGAFYNVRAKLVSCGRAEAILHHNGRGYGFRCHVVGHGIEGGFPATRYCGKASAAVSGDIFDGQASS